MKILTWLIQLLLVSMATSAFAQVEQSSTSDIDFETGKVFDEVVALVKEHFFEANFDTSAWRDRASRIRKTVADSKSHDEFSAGINELLSSLGASHTYYYSKLNPKRYQLLGIFHQIYDEAQSDLFVYPGIGIDTKSIDGRVFLSAVYDGLPAARAGLQFGDELIAIEGKPFHSIHSFAQKAGLVVRVEFIREGESRQVDVEVVNLDGRTMFATALAASTRIIERNGKKVGYIHVWSYAGSQYQEAIRSTILWGDLSQCDSLVLDLRDGWGGADVNYLNLFREPIVQVRSSSRSMEPQNYTGVWGKPVAVITNGGSTSGKELFAFGFKKLQLGKIFGERTAGAVVGGRAFLLSNGDVLYLAVSDVSVDGVRLEGVGVAPDIEVKRELTDPTDPQLDAALDFLAK